MRLPFVTDLVAHNCKHPACPTSDRDAKTSAHAYECTDPAKSGGKGKKDAMPGEHCLRQVSPLCIGLQVNMNTLRMHLC